ncbi:MAG: hypothetical protein IKU01_01620 [Bacteroidales bacterium]|nr:hypothetical protein [Bacteroidales bacterium]
MAYIELKSKTTTSLTVRLNGLGNYVYNDRATHWFLNGTDKETVSGPGANATYGAQYTFSNLSPNTTYTIKAVVYYYAGTSTQMSSTITTDSDGNTAKFTTNSLPAPSITLSTTTLSHNAIRATFTYDSNYPYYRLRWKASSSSTWIYSGSSYTSYSATVDYSIGSLSANTQYNIEVLVATNSSGSNSTSGATTNSSTLPPQSANVSITSTGTTTVNGKITIDSNYRYLQAMYRKESETTLKYYPTNLTYQSGTNWTFQITGLSTDTDYILNGRGSATGETSYAYTILSTGLSFYTRPSYSDLSATTNSITARISGLSSSYTGQRIIYMVAYLNGTEAGRTNQTINAGVTGSVDVTVGNLSPGTNYTIELSIYRYVDTTTYFMGSYSRSTEGFSITQWDWDNANSTANPYPATKSETQAAYNACYNGTAVSNFKWKVWNDLVYKVSEARVAGGNNDWNENYLSIQNTLMSDSSKTLTAARYNSLRYNIGSIYNVPNAHKINEVSAGDEVNGTTHFLNFVTYYLNAYIVSLNS